MKSEKLDSALKRALKMDTPPFPILVRFTHEVTQNDTAPLGLTASGYLATGLATVDQIDKLTERDDVMSVALVQQPRTSRKD
jgi:hypothetical protein